VKALISLGLKKYMGPWVREFAARKSLSSEEDEKVVKKDDDRTGVGGAT
jgi:hypothetical protein